MLLVEVLALIFWSFQLAPQCWTNYSHQSTRGLSTSMIISWTYGSFMTALYVILRRYSLLFLLQPNIFLFFSLICWGQALYYSPSTQVKYPHFGVKCAGLFVTLIFIVGVEILALFSSSSATPGWIFPLLGSLSTIFFGIGFLPQFAEIARSGSTQGISRLFLCIDMTGAVLSVTALVLHTHFQPISGTCYIIVFLCDLVILMISFLLPTQSRLEEPSTPRREGDME